MADVTIVAASIRPLDGARMRRYTAGAAGMTPGQPVYLSGNRTVDLADGSAMVTSKAIGVIVSCPNGALASVVGDELDICLWGPVTGYTTNMVAATLFYVDDDAGIIADAAGTKSTIIGHGEDAVTLFVDPQLVSLA